jgi:hypothetical protein
LSTGKELELLRELLKLHTRFGNVAFRRLDALLSDRERLEDVRTSIRAVVSAEPSRKLARTAKSIPKNGGRPYQVPESIYEIVRGDTVKLKLIEAFYRDFKEKRILPTLKDVRTFVAHLGTVLTAEIRTRDAAIDLLLQRLAQMNANDLENLSVVARTPVEGGLSAWSKMIIR